MRIITKKEENVWITITNTGDRYLHTKRNVISFKENPDSTTTVSVVVNNEERNNNVLLLSAIDDRLKHKNQQPLSMEEWQYINSLEWDEEIIETTGILSEVDGGGV